MKKSTLWLIVSVVIIAALVFLIYWGIKKGAKITYAKVIANKTGNSYKNYMTAEIGWVKARAMAIKSNQPAFTYNGSNYSADTGIKIV